MTEVIRVFVLATVMLALPAAPIHASERPNIVIILADDLGFSDIGCYGGEIETPHLDRLAANGLRFTQFYNTARCCPTRASLLTGLYPHQAGVGHMVNDRGTDGYRGDLNNRCLTIAEALGENGYRSYMAGKWHVTKHTGYWSGAEKYDSTHNWPIQRGFDRFWGTIHGAGSYWNPVSLTDGNTPISIPDGRPFYYTDAISGKASQFVREHHGDDPFFLYIAYTAPHWPLHAWPEDIARYMDRYRAGWDVLRAERFARMVNMGLVDPESALPQRDPQVRAWADAPYPEWQVAAMAVYAAMVDRMDRGIGQVMAALEQTGRLDNTLVFFLADNGGCAEGGAAFTREGRTSGLSCLFKVTRDGEPVHYGHYAEHMPGPANTYQEYGRPWANLSNTPFRLYKHWVHEGGIATPLIVHWPDGIHAKNELRRQPGHVIDLLPTCMDVAGGAFPDQWQGRDVLPPEGLSLRPVFEGRDLQRDVLYWEHEGNRAVRDGDWKLVSRGRNNAWELYDLATDRSELTDLAETHPQRVAAMAALWQTWAARCQVLPWPER